MNTPTNQAPISNSGNITTNPTWVTAPVFEPQPGTSRQNLNHLKDKIIQDTRPYILTQIGDKNWKALIDSGAMSSFINKETLKEILR